MVIEGGCKQFKNPRQWREGEICHAGEQPKMFHLKEQRSDILNTCPKPVNTDND
jgi:hypothetical protein